jgi:hypothetical protein
LTRTSVVAATALICSIAALIVATWAAIDAHQMRQDIRRLGDLLSRQGQAGVMRLEAIHPPDFDPDDR